MNDGVLVGVLHRLAYRAKQLQARLESTGVPLAVGRDRLTRHELHDDVRSALGSDVGVIETRDRGVRELRQGALLGGKECAARW
jgi:hypothetical protein